MKRQIPLYVVLALLTLASSCSVDASTTTPTSSRNAMATTSLGTGQEASCPEDGEPLETAKLYIEHNATDADTGVHGLFGGSAWSVLCIWDPKGNLILLVDPRNALNDLTVSDLFFESREPPNDEVSLADLRTSFPEGQYFVGGIDFEGVARVGKATFTHTIPAQPVIVSPTTAADEETANQATVSPIDLRVVWKPVTETLDGSPLDVAGYQVIVTKVDHDDPNGWSRPVFDVHLPPEVRALRVPQEFLEPGTLYELEILALEASGNQTITVGFFTTQ